MSNPHHQPKDLFYHDLFQYYDQAHVDGGSTFDVPSYMNTSFTDYNSFATAFGLSSSTSDHNEVLSSIIEGTHQKPNLGDGEVLMTPNSSVSSSSGEAGADEDSGSKRKREDRKKPRGSLEEGGDLLSPKKSSKIVKKKVEKKQREPRFAFMTKSEVDHLEDGYRWRKYGQKAVKNSPYPRSYYRCTTKKCGVKKRVERSFEDPSTVITTYEGQHNHPIPATLRGSIINLNPFSPTSSSASFGRPSFPQEYLFQMAHQQPQMMRSGGGGFYTAEEQYGLLQDVVLPSKFFKQERP